MSNSFYKTERLLIRPTFIEDYEFIYKLMNSHKWLQFIGDRNINTLDDAKNYIKENNLTQLEKLGYSNYTLIKRSDHKKIGVCGLYDRKGLDGIDLGYALLSEYEKKGYAYEASSKIVSIAHSEFKIQTLKAITLENNIASIKLLHKLGFNYKDHITVNNIEVKLFIKEMKENYS